MGLKGCFVAALLAINKCFMEFCIGIGRFLISLRYIRNDNASFLRGKKEEVAAGEPPPLSLVYY